MTVDSNGENPASDPNTPANTPTQPLPGHGHQLANSAALLRGRPCGPIPDPDALLDTAQQHAETPKEKINSTNPGLTGPAPSGMTH